MTEHRGVTSVPIILVPGFWLGAWAWDEVAGALRADGHDVTALTLPGLESVDADRSAITMSDHVDAICAAVRAADAPVVLAVHSGTGVRRLRRQRSRPRADRGDGVCRLRPRDRRDGPDFKGVEKPLVWEEIEAEENLDGLSEEQLETFQRRAVPQPGGVLREGAELANDARLDIPSTMICTAFTSEQYKAYAREQNPAWLRGLAELRNVTWVDLPTSHWPMWSRPGELAEIIGDVAKAPAGVAR